MKTLLTILLLASISYADTTIYGPSSSSPIIIEEGLGYDTIYQDGEYLGTIYHD